MAGRLDVQKTYKLFIGGKFPRSESGRYYPLKRNDKLLANICQASRKDFRSAVVAARKAVVDWSARSAYNRGQILYRIGEIMENRKAQFVEELQWQGYTKRKAIDETKRAIDIMVGYAGWCDKFQQLNSTVNPVASSHFNFSVPEYTGVVAAISPDNSGLAGFTVFICSVIAGGNSVILLAPKQYPLCAITFSEVLSTSDVPNGVVNILTGDEEELLPFMSGHMDVNAIIYGNDNPEAIQSVREMGTENLKRVIIRNSSNWMDESHENPYYIMDTQEIKTTWHPIEKISETGSGY